MTKTTEYAPPKVWTCDEATGGTFVNINRPIAGASHQKELPVGKHPLQLYSLGTPNGQKVTIMLEKLLAVGRSAAEYGAWLIKIGEGDQFGSGFIEINPSSKIPALMDCGEATLMRVSNPARSWYTSPKSSAPSCQRFGRPAPKRMILHRFLQRRLQTEKTIVKGGRILALSARQFKQGVQS